jgi:hypothetical protein
MKRKHPVSYEDFKDNLEFHKELIIHLKDEIKQLEALVKMMASALEFYEDKKTYISTMVAYRGIDQAPIGYDFGKRARTCLEAYRKAIE